MIHTNNYTYLVIRTFCVSRGTTPSRFKRLTEFKRYGKVPPRTFLFCYPGGIYMYEKQLWILLAVIVFLLIFGQIV